MDASEIKDPETLRAWLETRPKADAIAIGYRSALRAFPLLLDPPDFASKVEFPQMMIATLRCIILSGIAEMQLGPEIRAACTSASAMANYARLKMAGMNLSASHLLFAHVAMEIGVALASAIADGNTPKTIDRISEIANETSTYALAAGFGGARLGASQFFGWETIRSDCVNLQNGKNLTKIQLWPAKVGRHNSVLTNAMRTYWQTQNPTHWDFWLRWWDAATQGRPLDWQLQHDIALIPDNIWQSGPGPVAEAIGRIEAAHQSAQAEPSLETQIRRLPAPSATQIATTKAAMQQNRSMLPPTFDAIEGLILLEIERLQRLNYQDDLDQAEAHRQIRILITLYDAICALRAQLPETGPVNAEQAEKSVALMDLYGEKLAGLPRAKVNDVVDGVWSIGAGVVQVGLIASTSAALMAAFSMPYTAGIVIGSIVFARKNADQYIKAAREALPLLGKP